MSREISGARKITLSAAFEASSGSGTTTGGTTPTKSQSQVTGALAVSIVKNKNLALINTTSSILAGGALNVSAEALTQSATLADATGSADPDSGATEPEDETADDSDAETSAVAWIVGNTVKIADSTGGALVFDGTASTATSLVFKDAAGSSANTGVTVTYTTAGGTQGSETLTAADGKYTLALNLLDLKKGTEITVTATYATGTTPITGAYADGYEYTIKIASLSGGTIVQESRNEETGSVTYAFTVTPQAGYKISETTEGTTTSADVTYTYTKTDGTTATVKMSYNSTSKTYYFTIPGDVKEGTGITVSASFEPDTRTLAVDAAITNGTVTPSATAVKAGDEIELTVAPDAGYSATSVSYTYTKPDGAAGTGTVTANAEGKYILTVPDTKAETEISVTAVFEGKRYVISVDSADMTGGDSGTDYKAYVSLSAGKADMGDVIEVDLSDTGNQAGAKITAVTVTFKDAGGTVRSAVTAMVSSADGWKIAIPGTISGYTEGTCSVSVTLSPKTAAVTVETSTRGTATASVGRVDSGETITITMTPKAGYRATASSVKVTVTDGTKTTTANATMQSDGTFTYTPTFTGTSATVTITPSFTIGEDATTSGGKSVSLGVGVAVAVTMHTNSALIQSGDIQASSVS
jgi:hypothetical protein